MIKSFWQKYDITYLFEGFLFYFIHIVLEKQNKTKDKSQPYHNENILYLDYSGGCITVKTHRAVYLKMVNFILCKLYYHKLTLNPSRSCSIWHLFKDDLDMHLNKALVEYGKLKKEIQGDIPYYISRFNSFIGNTK